MLSFSIKILHLENVPADADMVEELLRKAGIAFEKQNTGNYEGYVKALKAFKPDVIVANLQIPTINYLQALNIVKEQELFIPLILVADPALEEFAINAMMTDGVADYVLTDRLKRLPAAIINAVEKALLIKKNNEYLLKEVENVTDITGYKAHEDALKKSEANLSAIIENTTDLVYSLDKDLKFITFNNQFRNAIKHVYGQDVVQGASVLDMLDGFDPVTAEKWKENYAKALAGETLQFVNEYPYGDGKIYLSYSINPIWETDNVIGLSCFSRDITRQKMDEAAIIKSEANLRSVFENTDLAIIMFDNELNIVSFNSNARKQSVKFFGKKLKVGQSGYDYFIQKRLSFIKDVIERVKKKHAVGYETFFEIQGGIVQWFEVKSVGVFKDKKEMVGVILTLKNITERKTAELERERMATDMIKRNQELEQFTYIISHNLRAPVANIKGLSGLLRDFEMPDPECYITLDALATSVNHLDQVILDLNQMLQVGKQVNEKKELIAMSHLVEDVRLEIQLMMQKNNVVINCDFTAVDELFNIKSYLYSIFQNLIINSIKYRRVNVTPVINIKSVLNNDDSLVTLHFEDNGKGIDLEKSGDQLYGLYKRFDFSVEGKGMGLFMVKKQVESLGGEIDVKSQPGNGTQFIIQLPW